MSGIASSTRRVPVLVSTFAVCGALLGSAAQASPEVIGSSRGIIAELEHVVVSSTRTDALSQVLGPWAGNLRIRDFEYDGERISLTASATLPAHDGQAATLFLKGTANDLRGTWLAGPDSPGSVEALELTTDQQGRLRAEPVARERVWSTSVGLQRSSVAEAEVNRTMPEGPEPHVGPYPAGRDITSFESRPGANKVLFIDIRPELSDGTHNRYSNEEVWMIWQVVASAFSGFDVNVTTSHSVYKARPVADTGIVVTWASDGRSHAPIGAFGTTTSGTVYRNPSAQTLAWDVLRQSGTILGLRNDGGQPGGEYFEGIPDFHWYALRGNYHFSTAGGEEALLNWSKGEYATATNKEDDIAIIQGNLPLIADDHSGTTQLKIGAEGKIDPLENRGHIGYGGDTDEFEFVLEQPGKVEFTVRRVEHYSSSQLDVYAAILNSSGDIVVEDNPIAIRSANVTRELPIGRYRLQVAGGAEGTPSHGFSNYATTGYYAISGEVNGTANDVTPPTVKITGPSHDDNVEIGQSVQVEITATDDTAVSWVELRVDGSVVGTTMAEPYSFLVETTGREPGVMELVATAGDPAGNTSKDTILIKLTTPDASTSGDDAGDEADTQDSADDATTGASTSDDGDDGSDAGDEQSTEGTETSDTGDGDDTGSDGGDSTDDDDTDSGDDSTDGETSTDGGDETDDDTTTTSSTSSSGGATSWTTTGAMTSWSSATSWTSGVWSSTTSDSEGETAQDETASDDQTATTDATSTAGATDEGCHSTGPSGRLWLRMLLFPGR